MALPTDFDSFFETATGYRPYAYQRELGHRPAPPSVIEVPTGSGKTHALLVSWLYERLVRGRAPRRLVYALPMRTLVEQTRSVAEQVRGRCGLTEQQLPIRTLMGGEASADWRESPEDPQILIGTIDMLLSRALNRGYAESRFAWPVSFGLLNSDCRWVLDEVQLMGPARGTSAQLDGLRDKLGTALPCETVWVSATVDTEALQTYDRPKLGELLALPEEDRAGALQRRLAARKVLERAELHGETTSELPRAIARVAAEAHVPGSRTLIVLNTVGRAQRTAAELVKLTGGQLGGPDVVLLHSRFRPPDRAARMAEALADVDPDGAGTLVVATQVIEAGVDMSSRVLLTEAAPFSSIVQRLGRCNRAGEFPEASVVWLDTGPVDSGARGEKAAAPYRPEDVNATRAALEERLAESLSPAALADAVVEEQADDPVVLRRRDLLDLFDTSPDLSGLDIDIAPFIREDDDRNVAVFFRALSGLDAAGREPAEQPPAERDELVQVPLSSLRDRDCWSFDHVEGQWRRVPGRAVPPGATVMLDAAGGGYEAAIGWDPARKAPVAPHGPTRDGSHSDAYVSDPLSAGPEPQELLPHLAATANAAGALARNLDLPQAWQEALAAAAALHDVGKAHAVFQETLRQAMDRPDEDGRLWAKSGRRGRRHRRPHFRHELASALALRSLDGTLLIGQRELVTYLVAAHHGKVRLSIRPAPDEPPPSEAAPGTRWALGLVEGESLPALETPLGPLPSVPLVLRCMDLGAPDSWTATVLRLRDDANLGPFRLAFLEALVRVSDWRGSA